MYSLGIAEHEDDRVASQEQFADEAVLVDGLGALLAAAGFGYLRMTCGLGQLLRLHMTIRLTDSVSHGGLLKEQDDARARGANQVQWASQRVASHAL